jgi:hypothetical protein
MAAIGIIHTPTFCANISNVVLGGVMFIMLAIWLKVRGFKPGRKRWIFNGDKNP